MSKVYKCDACGMVIEYPHRAKMKEFYIDYKAGACRMEPVNKKRKVKIHLCDDCFHVLYEMARKKEKVKNEPN